MTCPFPSPPEPNPVLGRWYNVAVAVFWLATMSWLVTSKVLPPLLVGEPPTYREIVRAGALAGQNEPSAWRLSWDGRLVGWAQSRSESRGRGLVELVNQVHFNDLPWQEMMPVKLGALGQVWGEASAGLELDAETAVLVDPLGRPEEFRSTVRLGLMPEAIRMRGHVDGNQLLMTVRVGDFSYPTRLYLASDALLGDVLSPQPRLPNLRVGQTWTVPVYSPFAAPNQPVEVLKATVEREETIVWGGQGVRTRLVVYRGDEGAGVGSGREWRGKSWVRGDGIVLRQEARLNQHLLRFELVAPEEPLPLGIFRGEAEVPDLPPAPETIGPAPAAGQP